MIRIVDVKQATAIGVVAGSVLPMQLNSKIMGANMKLPMATQIAASLAIVIVFFLVVVSRIRYFLAACGVNSVTCAVVLGICLMHAISFGTCQAGWVDKQTCWVYV